MFFTKLTLSQTLMKILNEVQTVLHGTLDIIYPNHCQLCADDLKTNEQYICVSCAYDLPYIDANSREQEQLSQLFTGRIKIEGIYSLFAYNKGNQVQHLLHQLKYHGKTKMGAHFGSLLGKNLPATDIDLLLPVPLHPKKLHQRGYNQSMAIARGIQQVTNKSILEKAMCRKSYNLSQTRFSKYDRWENVRSIFEVVRPAQVKGKHLLLIDDVLTTGATIEACAQELLKLEDCRVSVATLAARV